MTLQSATDAAALVAARMPDSDLTIADRRRDALSVLRLNMTGEGEETTAPVVDIVIAEGATRAVVEATYRVDNPFASFLPSNFLTVGASSTAESRDATNHVDLFFLVDNSMSMGIGQTARDRDDMLTDATIHLDHGITPCAVACHIPDTPEMNSYPYYKRQGIRMRIDAVTDALRGFLEDVRDQEAKTRNTRISLRTTGDHDDEIIPTFAPDRATALTTVNGIELESRPLRGNTHLALALDHIADIAGDGGGGAKIDSAKKVVVLMTDGIEHGHRDNPSFKVGPYVFPDSSSVATRSRTWLEANNTTKLNELTVPGDWTQTSNNIYNWGVGNGFENGGALIQILDPRSCQRLKDQGIIVIVMNIEYSVPEYRYNPDGGPPRRYDDPAVELHDGNRDRALFDLKPDIEPELEKCASSPDLVFSVEEETEIQQAFEEIFGTLYDEKVVYLTR